MTAPGGVGAARGDAPTPQDAAATGVDLDAIAEVVRLRRVVADLEDLCDEADARGAASLPPGMTMSGCVPAASALYPMQVRAVLARLTFAGVPS